MKKILIIGATSSIAQNCARIWISRGDKLFLVARNKDKLTKTANDLKLSNKKHTYYLDLNDISSHKKMLDNAVSALEGIDVVLISHGTLPNQKACEKSVNETLAEIKTNALSVISLLTLIANLFENQQRGVIAVISSVAGDRGKASNYVYGSSKAMVTTFASGLRQRLHKSNVTIVTIKPGFVDTPMTTKFKKGLLWAKPAAVAKKIIKGIDLRKNEVYAPAFWKAVMVVVKNIPLIIYKKLSL
jgi:short-subunit dehydrogenase